jgi:hydroxyethylthiazole kinase-like uncharacterized protein yjeF
MIPILTPKQMKQADETAIKRFRIPSLVLMENAGTAVADVIGNILPFDILSMNNTESIRILVICGKGNNGGDGFVISRILLERGFDVTTLLMEHPRELGGDAAVQYRTLLDVDPRNLPKQFQSTLVRKRRQQYTVIVDAMLGTSFRGALRGKYLTAVKWCNQQNAIRIAVDIPTGLNGETGEVVSDAFRADVTVTMSNPKSGFYIGSAKEFTGDVIVAQIGIPSKAIPKSKIQLVETEEIKRTFPKRAVNSHKHSVGKIFVLAGSRSMMGAALLSVSAAMRTGAGQVILGIPESEYMVAAKRTLEVMPLPLPATAEGSLSMNALPEIIRRMEWCDVLLIGCGLSRNEETQELIRTVIKKCRKPMVIDADGLNALAADMSILKGHRTKNLVLTPHVGEFSRLSGISSKEIERNKFSLAAHFAEEYRVTLVLKGAPSIVADAQGMISVNCTGNPGMSTAGSGDVLSGIVAALIGQGNDPGNAAVNGVFIHGAAGDAAAEKIGMQGMIASDMIKLLPETIRKVLQT